MRRALKPVAAASLLALALLGGCGPSVGNVNSSDRASAPSVTVPGAVVGGDADGIGEPEIADIESELEALEDYLDELEAMLEVDLPMAP